LHGRGDASIVAAMSTPRMAWAHVTVDCLDPGAVAEFWGRLLDLTPIERADGWVVLGPTATGGPMLYFQPVGEPKLGKARLHLDLWVDDLDAAVARVEAVGGADTGERHEHANGTVAVMTDPEGTEFCLITFPVAR
jgi:predicted enzyme related to lactoylglutathione lyase